MDEIANWADWFKNMKNVINESNVSSLLGSGIEDFYYLDPSGPG